MPGICYTKSHTPYFDGPAMKPFLPLHTPPSHPLEKQTLKPVNAKNSMGKLYNI